MGASSPKQTARVTTRKHLTVLVKGAKELVGVVPRVFVYPREFPVCFTVLGTTQLWAGPMPTACGAGSAGRVMGTLGQKMGHTCLPGCTAGGREENPTFFESRCGRCYEKLTYTKSHKVFYSFLNSF